MAQRAGGSIQPVSKAAPDIVRYCPGFDLTEVERTFAALSGYSSEG